MSDILRDVNVPAKLCLYLMLYNALLLGTLEEFRALQRSLIWTAQKNFVLMLGLFSPGKSNLS